MSNKKKKWVNTLPFIMFTIVAATLVSIIALVKQPIWIPIIGGVSLLALIVLVSLYEYKAVSERDITSMYNKIGVDVETLLENNKAMIDSEINVNETMRQLINTEAHLYELVKDMHDHQPTEEYLPIGNEDDDENQVSYHGLKNALINDELVGAEAISKIAKATKVVDKNGEIK